MNETRVFHIGTVINAYYRDSDVAPDGPEGVNDLLRFLTGDENVDFLDQEVVCEAIQAQFPHIERVDIGLLTEAITRAKDGGAGPHSIRDIRDIWLRRQVHLFGNRVELRPMAEVAETEQAA